MTTEKVDALDDLAQLSREWRGEGNSIAEAAALIAQIEPLVARVRELEATVARVEELRGRLDLIPHPQEPHVVADIAEGLTAALKGDDA